MQKVGFYLLMLFGFLLLTLLLVGQTGALINYPLMVSWGLQESADTVGILGVAMNKGFAAADTIIYMPMLLIGLIGLWRKKSWGFMAMSGALAITAYWPMACWFFILSAKGAPGFHLTHYVSYSIFFVTITTLALCGLVYLYKNKRSI